ncbi:unnamed protein product [Heligmosomoides polygyrus]|uniref:MIF4G domain-containing protein n=1 Tax=Heligmosomoides polygyrus TaxID=6339 RepID=A0A183GQN4_HELPZ|nr:unnamed protein product [Heligmosomoides polygyrus]
MVPPPREREVPAQQEIRTAREFKPSPRERSTSDDRLRVNIDEILRLGAIMERRYLSPKKKQPEAFSTHLITAVGDVRMEKSLACDALNVLMYKHTITPDEYLRLCQYLENVNPITVGSLAQLLRSSTQYYSNLPSFRFSQRQPTQS